jgi:RNA polymerase sigma factor for flagellar operon FliA
VNAAASEATPEASDEAMLWTALQQEGSAAAREALFLRYAPFARRCAARHGREHNAGDIDPGDLRQLAYAGLLEALDRFDPAHGAPFKSFAGKRIMGSMRDGVARMSEVREQISWRHRMRRERSRSLAEGEDAAPALSRLADIAVGLALGFMLEGTGLVAEDESASGGRSGYDSAAWNEMLSELQREVARLPVRERTILAEHYGGGMNFAALAGALGVSKGRISQLHRGALLLLRRRLDARGHFRLEQ